MELLVLSQVVKRLLCPPSKGQQCLAYLATAVLAAASPLSPAVPCCGRSLLSLSVALLCYQLTALLVLCCLSGCWCSVSSSGADISRVPLLSSIYSQFSLIQNVVIIFMQSMLRPFIPGSVCTHWFFPYRAQFASDVGSFGVCVMLGMDFRNSAC